jgi:hypothetical protein
MTIDKFGRSLKSQDKNLLKGLKGEGYNLTPDGDYDIQGKRLVKVGVPKATHDAATKQYVDSKVIPCKADIYDIKKRRLHNVGDPLQETEAVNLRTLNKLALTLTNNNYNASGKQLKGLAKPTDSEDAVTKSYIDTSMTPMSTMLAKHELDITSINNKLTEFEGKIAENRTDYDKQMRKFGTLVFNYINTKYTGRAAILPTAGVNDYLNWEEIFKLPLPKNNDKEEEEEETYIPESDGVLTLIDPTPRR